jgi:hypothetical protein
MEEKSEHFIFNFLRQYGPKDDKSFLGKLVSKIKKRDMKAKHKGLAYFEDPPSDFDY